jgi:hypothetical protein
MRTIQAASRPAACFSQATLGSRRAAGFDPDTDVMAECRPESPDLGGERRGAGLGNNNRAQDPGSRRRVLVVIAGSPFDHELTAGPSAAHSDKRPF